MGAHITLPLWAAIILALLAAWAAIDRILVPSVRWAVRRRANRAIEELNTRLKLRIQPFKLTKRQVLIDRLMFDPEVLYAVDEHAKETGVPREVAMEKVKRYASEIVPSFSAYAYFRIGTRIARGVSQMLYRVRIGYRNDDALAAVDPSSSVIFVINHRSNMDYVLVTYIAASSSALSYAVGEWAQVWGLRGLIRSYPRSVGIIKEFLQNADDAGATWLRVIWDERTHPREQLPDPRMAALQGPALVLVSDQVFTSADFDAIRRIGESSKSELGPKTGRFGLGFNTAYNVTDYPAFVSDRWAVVFDPHRRCVDADGEGTGRRWELADLWQFAPDVLRAFAAGGLGERAASHPETIFRLPVRDAAQAAQSEICDEPFERQHFDQMVKDLIDAGDELLLFARNVLDLRVDEARSFFDAQPRDKGFGNARLARNLFEAAVANHASRIVALDAPTPEQLSTLVAADVPSTLDR